MKSKTSPDKKMAIFNNSKYFGKHVLITKEDIYAVKSAQEASRLFDQLVKKGTIPTVTFVPKEQSFLY